MSDALLVSGAKEYFEDLRHDRANSADDKREHDLRILATTPDAISVLPN
jgi:hypothetical protein